MIERIGAKFRLVFDFLEGRGIKLTKTETKPLAHFAFPLMEQGTSGTNDEHPVSAATSDQFGQNETRFDGFAETDVIGEQEARSGHGQGAHDGDELVRLDAQASWLSGEKRMGPERLFEEKGFMVDAEGVESCCPFRVELRCDGLDGVVFGMNEVEFVAA